MQELPIGHTVLIECMFLCNYILNYWWWNDLLATAITSFSQIYIPHSCFLTSPQFSLASSYDLVGASNSVSYLPLAHRNKVPCFHPSARFSILYLRRVLSWCYHLTTSVVAFEWINSSGLVRFQSESRILITQKMLEEEKIRETVWPCLYFIVDLDMLLQQYDSHRYRFHAMHRTTWYSIFMPSQWPERNESGVYLLTGSILEDEQNYSSY